MTALDAILLGGAAGVAALLLLVAVVAVWEGHRALAGWRASRCFDAAERISERARAEGRELTRQELDEYVRLTTTGLRLVEVMQR